MRQYCASVHYATMSEVDELTVTATDSTSALESASAMEDAPVVKNYYTLASTQICRILTFCSPFPHFNSRALLVKTYSEFVPVSAETRIHWMGAAESHPTSWLHHTTRRPGRASEHSLCRRCSNVSGELYEAGLQPQGTLCPV